MVNLYLELSSWRLTTIVLACPIVSIRSEVTVGPAACISVDRKHILRHALKL